LLAVREKGYAVEDEEGELGIRCIGSPIFGHDGKVIAAVSVTALRNELPSTTFHDIGLYLRDKALLISERMGYEPKLETAAVKPAP